MQRQINGRLAVSYGPNLAAPAQQPIELFRTSSCLHLGYPRPFGIPPARLNLSETLPGLGSPIGGFMNAKSVVFGQCFWADFPYHEGYATKRRLCMVLVDKGDSIVFAYTTTNGEQAHSISVGALTESRTCQLVPDRYAVISKAHVYWNTSARDGRAIRIDLAVHKAAAAIIRAVLLIARHGGYGEYGASIETGLREAVVLADNKREAQCQTTTARSRSLTMKTANSCVNSGR